MKKMSPPCLRLSVFLAILSVCLFAFFFSCATNPPVFDEMTPPLADENENIPGVSGDADLFRVPEDDPLAAPLSEMPPEEPTAPEPETLLADGAETQGMDDLPPEAELPELAQDSPLLPAAAGSAPFTLAEPDLARTRQLDVPEVPPAPPLPVLPPESAPEPAAPASPGGEATAQSMPEEKTGDPEISGGVWVDTPSYPYVAANSQLEPPADTTPSRVVTLPSNAFLDIEYPGTGWIYLGENGSDPLLVFSARKLLGDNTLFTMRSKKSGTSLLHFYKQDLLTDSYIDDYLEVTVTPEQANSGERVSAPQYAAIVPPNQQPAKIASKSAPPAASPVPQESPAAEKKESVPPVVTRQPTVVQTSESAPSTVTETQKPAAAPASPPPQNAATRQSALTPPATQPAPAAQPAQTPPTAAASQNAAAAGQSASAAVADMANLSPDELVKQAEAALKTNNAAGALLYLDAFFDRAVGPLDYGWFLRAQAYETKTTMQNIRAAVDAYQTLMKQYPASRYWKQASERVAYLNRFYFNIR